LAVAERISQGTPKSAQPRVAVRHLDAITKSQAPSQTG